MTAGLDSDPDAAPEYPASDRPAEAGTTAPPRARRDPLFFVVFFLLTADIVFGLGLAVFAQTVLKFPPMAGAGLVLAVLGLGILAYFLLLGDGRSQSARDSKKPRRP